MMTVTSGAAAAAAATEKLQSLLVVVLHSFMQLVRSQRVTPMCVHLAMAHLLREYATMLL